MTKKKANDDWRRPAAGWTPSFYGLSRLEGVSRGWQVSLCDYSSISGCGGLVEITISKGRATSPEDSAEFRGADRIERARLWAEARSRDMGILEDPEATR
jgi:hypothetical protein